MSLASESCCRARTAALAMRKTMPMYSPTKDTEAPRPALVS